MFNEFNEWILFSEQVPGYAEKFGVRGVRRRNAAILEEMRHVRKESKVDALRERLAENNLPLARFVAERWRRRGGWSDDRVEDAYQECCVVLWGFLRKTSRREFSKLDGAMFSREIYLRMSNRLQVLYNPVVVRNQVCYEPFREESFSVAPEERLNLEFCLEFLNDLPVEPRYKEIFWDFIFGNEERHIWPGFLEDVGFHYGMSRERARQICVKVQRTLEKVVKNHLKYHKDDFHVEDFFEDVIQ